MGECGKKEETLRILASGASGMAVAQKLSVAETDRRLGGVCLSTCLPSQPSVKGGRADV